MSLLLVATLGGWAAAGLLLVPLLLRDYSAGRVQTRTGVLIWTWHAFNYTVLAVLAAGDVWGFGLPAAARLPGLALIGLGLAAVAAGFFEFRSLARLTGSRQDQLVDTGIYRFSRHPQYLGIILTLIGAGIASDSAAALLFALVLSLVFVLYLPLEERYVARAFGEAYERYRSRVPMLIGGGR